MHFDDDILKENQILIENIHNSSIELIDFGEDKINPNMFMEKLSLYSQKYNAHYTTGIGNVQMWAAQSLQLIKNQRLLIPGGLSSMGSALPYGTFGAT